MSISVYDDIVFLSAVHSFFEKSILLQQIDRNRRNDLFCDAMQILFFHFFIKK